MKPMVIATFHIHDAVYDSIHPDSYVDYVCTQEPQRSKIEYVRSLNIPVEISVVAESLKQT